MTERRRLSPSQKATVLQRHKFACAECRDERGPFEFDHVIPLSMGGADNLTNTQPLCRPCHSAKSAAEATPRAKADRCHSKHGQFGELRQRQPKLPAEAQRRKDRAERRKDRAERRAARMEARADV